MIRRAWAAACAVALLALTAVPAAAVEPAQLELAGFAELPVGLTGDGVVVAVVDSGIDPDHPAFEGRLVPGWDFVDQDAELADENGHGTHVAGIIAASGPAPGAARGAKIMPVRVMDASGAASAQTVAQGVLWAAEQGAEVINLSIGDSGRLGRIRKDGPIAAAIRAVSDTAVVVVAAGNDDQFEQLFRAGVDALVVVAVTDDGQLAPFTNVGDPRSVAAPGVNVRSTVPTAPTTLFPDGTDGTGTLSGTSMAAPFVSAEAAVLLQAGVSHSEVIDTITRTASSTGDDRLGAGIVDAAAAVSSLTASSPPTTTPPLTPPSAPEAAATRPTPDDDYVPIALVGIGVLAVICVVAAVAVIRRP